MSDPDVMTRLKTSTRKRLEKHMIRHQSYNDFIVKLLDFYEDPKRVHVDLEDLGLKEVG